MNFGDLFGRLGRGFGLVQALQNVSNHITSLRSKVVAGEVSAEESAREEEALLRRLNEFYTDARWKDIEAHKQHGEDAMAKEMARSIRDDYGL